MKHRAQLPDRGRSMLPGWRDTPPISRSIRLTGPGTPDQGERAYCGEQGGDQAVCHIQYLAQNARSRAEHQGPAYLVPDTPSR